MLIILLTYIVFLALAIISFYIPGRLIIDLFQTDKDQYEKHFLSWIFGLSSFLLLSYILSFLKIPQALYIYVIICLFFYIRLSKRQTLKKFSIIRLFKQIDHIILLIIILGSLSFLFLTFFSGYFSVKGLQFIGTNATDGIVNLAYVKNQLINFPPQNPGVAGIPLHGYHFFYDFLLSRFELVYHFTPEDLFFRLFPLLISCLYGGGILFFTKTLTKNLVAQRLILFLSYFAQSTTSIFLIYQRNYDFLGINQPPMLINDPSVVLGIALLLTALALIPKAQNKYSYSVIVGIILGILTQLKVYTGVIGLITLALFIVFSLIKSKGKHIVNYFVLLTVTGFITFFTFVINNIGSGSLVYAPLLFYEQYLQGPNFSFLQWELKLMVYREHHNIIRIIQMFIEAAAFVWFINLGLRLILIFQVHKLFKKDFWQNNYFVLLFLVIFTAIFIPSFFIQSTSIFDIVQFFWISLVLLCIPTGIVWTKIYQKINKSGKFIVMTIIFICSFPGYLFVESLYFSPSSIMTIPYQDLQIYNNITNIVPKNEFIVSLTFHPQPLYAAMTGRSIYYEGEVTPYINPGVIKERKKNISTLLSAIKTCDIRNIKQTLEKIGSSFVITNNENDCLNNNSVKGKKIKSPTLSFYQLM